MVCIDEKVYLKDIEKLVGNSIPSETKEGFEPDPNIKPDPIKQKGGNRHKSNHNRSKNSGRSPGGSRNYNR